MKILVHTFWISPYRGSEFAVAWDYITAMSQNHELFVICGSSSYAVGDFTDLDRWLETNTLKNVTFLKIQPSRMTLFLNLAHKYGISTYSFYIAYKQWEKDVYKIIRSSSFITDIDLIHFMGPVGYREPGYLWKLRKPYIWGPIGGFENVKWCLLKHLKTDKLKFLFRNVANRLQTYTNRRVKRAINKADIVIGCTSGNVNIIERLYKKKALYLPENGINSINIRPVNTLRKSDRINIMWIGTMEARKMPNMLLDIAARLRYPDKVMFHVIGGGKLLTWVKESIHERQLDSHFIIYGQIPREQIFDLLLKADLHIISSAMEANTTVIWETLSFGIPTIAIDHCGMTDIINNRCGIKIPMTNYRQIVDDFACAIDALAMNSDDLLDLKLGAQECATKYTWDKRIEFYEGCFKMAINSSSV